MDNSKEKKTTEVITFKVVAEDNLDISVVCSVKNKKIAMTELCFTGVVDIIRKHLFESVIITDAYERYVEKNTNSITTS